ncbi:MAG: LEA type 2 family protein [Nitrospira sp.]|nr:LEA type 2 family protein [Nitrospira sp.]
MRVPKLLLFITALATLSGCASWFATGERPDVLVANITPLESTPFEQRLKIDLRVRNPNDYELHVTGMDVRLDLNGKRLARGLGNQAFTVPRLSDSVVTIETTTSTLDVVRQVLGLRKVQALNYEISGVLHMKNGRLPFENSGTLVEKGELSGILAP